MNNMTEKFRGADAAVNESAVQEIKSAASTLITELLDSVSLRAGDILVIGCSSSEILGSKIG